MKEITVTVDVLFECSDETSARSIAEEMREAALAVARQRLKPQGADCTVRGSANIYGDD